MSSMKDKLRGMPTLTGTPPGTFDTDAAPLAPAELFGVWLEAAIGAGEREPTAMTLSTVDDEGWPDARVLILKDLDADGGWWFAGSTRSAKGRQLHTHPVAALSFFWPRVARSVRIRGTVAESSREQSAADFRERGIGARAVALTGRQSSDLDDPAQCRHAVDRAREQLEQDLDLVADDWRLWRLQADVVEFWQGDSERRHTRLTYRRSADGWSHGLLWP